MNTLKSLVLLLLLSSTAQAVTYRSDVAKSKLLEYGKKHNCVVQIIGTPKGGRGRCSGSGVIIGPHIILTAAHVMADVEDSYATFGGKELYPIESAVCPNKFNMDKYGVGDIAVCYVKKELPQEFYVKLYDKDDEVNRNCSIAGWGRNGTFNDGHKSTPSQRMAGTNVIDGIDRDMLTFSPSRKSDNTCTSLEALISPGDSGGGLFIAGKLAGIHSILSTSRENATINDLNGGYHCTGGSTRVSRFKEWIEKTSEELVNFNNLVKNANEALGVK